MSDPILNFLNNGGFLKGIHTEEALFFLNGEFLCYVQIPLDKQEKPHCMSVGDRLIAEPVGTLRWPDPIVEHELRKIRVPGILIESPLQAPANVYYATFYPRIYCHEVPSYRICRTVFICDDAEFIINLKGEIGRKGDW